MDDEPLRASVGLQTTHGADHGREIRHSPGSNTPCSPSWCDAGWEADAASSGSAGLGSPGLPGCRPLSAAGHLLPFERPASPYALDPPDLACQPSGAHAVGDSLAPGAPSEYRRRVHWVSSISPGAASPQQRSSLRYNRPGTPWQPRLYTVHAVAAGGQAAQGQAEAASPPPAMASPPYTCKTHDGWQLLHCGAWEKQPSILKDQQHEKGSSAASPALSPQTGRTNTPSPTAFFGLGNCVSPCSSGGCAVYEASPTTRQVAAPAPCTAGSWAGMNGLQQGSAADFDSIRPSSPPWPEGVAYPGLPASPGVPSSLPRQLMDAEEDSHSFPYECGQLGDPSLGADSNAGSCWGDCETTNSAEAPLTLHGADWSSLGVLIKNLRRSAFGSDLPSPMGPATCREDLQGCKSQPCPWAQLRLGEEMPGDQDGSSPAGIELQAGVPRQTPGEQPVISASLHGTSWQAVSPRGKSTGWRPAWISPGRSPGSKRAPPALRIPGSKDLEKEFCGYSPLGGYDTLMHGLVVLGGAPLAVFGKLDTGCKAISSSNRS